MVIFANGKSFNDISVFGNTMNFQGAIRRTLEITIANEDASFDELFGLFSDPSALDVITTKTAETADSPESQNTHLHFTIPVSLGTSVVADSNVWVMKVAEMSALEIMQAQQAVDIQDTQVALMELAELVTE